MQTDLFIHMICKAIVSIFLCGNLFISFSYFSSTEYFWVVHILTLYLAILLALIEDTFRVSEV